MLVRELLYLQDVITISTMTLFVLFVGQVLALVHRLSAFSLEIVRIERRTRPEPQGYVDDFIRIGGCNDS